jgi:integrase
MPVDDLWYLSNRSPDGERVRSQRYGRGKRYRARWVGEDGRTRTALFDRKVDAERQEANQRADVSRGQWIDPRAGRATVREYGARWREQQLRRPSTVAREERAVRLHVDPILGDLPMAAVRPSHLKAWVKDRSTVLAPSTLHVVYAYLTSIFTAAVVDRVIGVSPCVGVRLPDIERGDRFIPTPDRVHALAEALPGRYAPMVYVAAGCGLRPGEVMGLELGHVDFLRREIRVEQQLTTLVRRPPFLAPVKTKTSRRTVELPAVVAAALSEHIRACPPVPVEVDDETDLRKPRRRPATLLFTNANVAPIHRSNWSHTWTPAVKAAGLPEGFGLHGLRHYFATLLIHAGASVKTVQLALGHSSPTVTLNTYTHEWPDAVDRTRSLVDSALGTVPVISHGEAV